MPWTTHLLVVANRTIESEELLQALRARATAGPIEVTLVAPADAGREPTTLRLERALKRLAEEEILATGIVGHSDPLVAVMEAWDPRRFDEVIVMTLPSDASHWMARGLPRRIQRLTGAHVTHVIGAATAAGPRVRSIA